MTDISASAPTGYMTDGEILAWLEEKSAQQYGDVRELMSASNERGELMKDLAQLKADIDQGKPADEILAEMQDLETKYAGTPLAAELHDLLGPMETTLTPGVLTNDEYNEMMAINNRLQGVNRPDDYDPEADQARLAELQQKSALPTMAALKEPFGAKIQSEIDQLSRLDQLGLVQIQSDINDAQQTAQLASSLIASGDRTMNTIIGNYRG